MSLRLDHVVIRVRDLNTACASYSALGFTVVPGGEHPGARGQTRRVIHHGMCVLRDDAPERQHAEQAIPALELGVMPPGDSQRPVTVSTGS